jgi:hypothetical protein
MPRKSSSVVSSSPPPPHFTPILNTPVTHPPSSLSKTLMEGFAFGTGSSIALSMPRIFDTSSSNSSSKMNKNTLDIEDDQGKNKQPNQCEQILSQLKDCFQTDNNMCGDLVDTYLLECHNNCNV